MQIDDQKDEIVQNCQLHLGSFLHVGLRDQIQHTQEPIQLEDAKLLEEGILDAWRSPKREEIDPKANTLDVPHCDLVVISHFFTKVVNVSGSQVDKQICNVQDVRQDVNVEVSPAKDVRPHPDLQWDDYR